MCHGSLKKGGKIVKKWLKIFFKVDKSDKRLLLLMFILFLCAFAYRPDIFFETYILHIKGELIAVDKFDNTTVYLYKYGDIQVSKDEINKVFVVIRNSYADFPFYVANFPNHKFYFDPSKKRPLEKFEVVLTDADDYCNAFGDSYGYYVPFCGATFIKWNNYCDNFKFWVEYTIKHETFHHSINVNKVKTEELMAEQFELFF